MTYQVLARKWRPRDFAHIVGQAHVVRALVNALDAQRLHHAYLFAGTRGVGKTTIARILAKALNCEAGVSAKPCNECAACREIDEGRFVDLLEVDAASRAKVDETRELMDNVQFAPARGRFKVYLIDEVHMFSNHSFNALLKTLEEPPPHVKFLFATTDPQKLPVTVLSRCLQFNLKRIAVDEIASQLDRILDEEGVKGELGVSGLLARAADGSMRDALSLLDQAIAFGAGELNVKDVRNMLGSVDRRYVNELVASLARSDARALLDCVQRMAAEATDFASATDELIHMLQNIAISQVVPDAPLEEVGDTEALRALASELSPEDVQLYYQIALLGRRDIPLAPDTRGGFEMMLLRMCAFRPVGVGEGGTEPPPLQSKASLASVDKPAREASRERASLPDIPAAQPQTGADASEDITAQTWPRIIEQLSLSGLARQLAVNSLPIAREDSRVRLRLSPSHKQLTASGVKQKLQTALSTYCGEPVSLDIELAEPKGDTPATAERKDAQARQQEALRAIERDPNVRALCETFDAEIDRSSVQSVDS
jgi:DNA polymerase-3 subunit gamma/tau